MSYERAMDPNDDPERRAHMERLRQQDPRQLKIPFEESARPEPDETDEEIQKSLKKATKEIRRKHGDG